MPFADFWRAAAGSDPGWLYFDGRVADCPGLSRINGRGIHLVTIRHRGAAPLRRLVRQPASARKAAVIDVPGRCHQRIRYLAEEVHLRGYEGPIRQVAAGGLGREVRLKVNLDAALTAIADGCYRRLAPRLHGFEKAAPKPLYRRFIEAAGTVAIGEDRLTVALDHRCHDPILREAAPDRDPFPIPWIGHRRPPFTCRWPRRPFED
jgi:hypothetical protein